ncbi:SseB family protein [Paracoccus laeviglucosivorans]|uniref:SseB protein N-terminal domain-containing protein n=1 Tax=Paracoccus laeviglucosivorans TaxID=1197861 RepID=A0A521BTB6_9RHOB|nr:SseB family protein [Paracoccus laeviglucosivorans]SMO50305.1 SseB protein N-terminal domain-containing protein [Paracoccus laeviglucosivorans]
MTQLDDLCRRPFHEAQPAQRARILSRLADTELFVALTAEPVGDQAELQIYDLPDGAVALACDAEDRLAGFLGGPVSYVALPGRVLAATLTPEGRGLLLNPGHPSEMLLEAETLDWLARALEAEPSMAGEDAPEKIGAPRPQALLHLAEPLAQRLGDMRGLIESAALVACDWADGRTNHMLILRGVDEDRRAPIAKAFAELLAFLPEVAGGTDIAFSDSALPRLALVLEPPPATADEPVPQRDPNAPPRLR